MTASENSSAHGRTTLFVCATCKHLGVIDAEGETRAGEKLLHAIRRHAQSMTDAPRIESIECLSNCNHGCTVAVAARGKWTYVVGRLDPNTHAEDVLTFARQHQDAPNGAPRWRERPEIGKRNVIARVPPLAAAAAETSVIPEPAE